MKYSLLFSLALLVSAISCAEHIPNKHEQLYLDTADSLKTYQGFAYLKKHLASNEKARDLLKMDYDDFKEKHTWNDEEMDVFADIIQGHVSIAKTINGINTN